MNLFQVKPPLQYYEVILLSSSCNAVIQVGKRECVMTSWHLFTCSPWLMTIGSRILVVGHCSCVTELDFTTVFTMLVKQIIMVITCIISLSESYGCKSDFSLSNGDYFAGFCQKTAKKLKNIIMLPQDATACHECKPVAKCLIMQSCDHRGNAAIVTEVRPYK